MNFPEILFVQGQMQSKHFKRLQSYDCIYLQKILALSFQAHGMIMDCMDSLLGTKENNKVQISIHSVQTRACRMLSRGGKKIEEKLENYNEIDGTSFFPEIIIIIRIPVSN